jgi:hypothetical protein
VLATNSPIVNRLAVHGKQALYRGNWLGRSLL